MFSSTGLFKKVSCPRLEDCSLPSCIFSHEETNNKPLVSASYDPASAGDPEQPPLKRRRIDFPEDETRVVIKSLPAQSVPVSHNIPVKKSPTKVFAKPLANKEPVKITSLTRDVSPPPEKQQQRKVLPAEKLVPRQVPKAPAVFKTRLSLTELLHKYMSTLNQQVISSNNKELVLSDQELINIVLNEEEQLASKLGSEIYRNAMSQKVLRFKKLSVDDWSKYVVDYRQQHKSTKQNPETGNDAKKTHDGATKLSSVLEIAVLQTLQTKLEDLDQYGYVTVAPSSAEIEKSNAATNSAAGYEKCDRCGTRFQCFPGRNADGQLTTRGTCHYHWARIDRSQSYKNARMYGQAEALYPCCNQPAGSEGCTAAETHVFKVTDVKRLASLLQFETTPATKKRPAGPPVAFDCEMAYTTHGMELVRVTAISWPHKKELLDVLVRPYGEILDLNTRFSGVSQEQFAMAPAYGSAVSVDSGFLKEGEIEHPTLQKVDSPAVARQLLFDILTPNTALIGHAIDNDLNACRIIHPFVVDTVLLYPHPRGLPIRYGLKMLTSKYLNRAIQTGGAQGHDSKEDSIATGDLVRAKVAERWAEMRLSGWIFSEGILLSPN